MHSYVKDLKTKQDVSGFMFIFLGNYHAKDEDRTQCK